MQHRNTRRLRGALLAALGAKVLGTAATADAQSWRTLTASRQTWGEKALDVQVEYGAGRLTVEPAKRDLLYEFRLRYDEDQFTPVTEYDRARGKLRLAVETKDRKKGARVNRIHEDSRAALHLARNVPVALDLSFGAGEARVELGGMAVRRLHVSTGASDTRLSFRTPNRIRAESVRLEAGAASFRATGLGNARAEHFQFEGGVGETLLDFSGRWERNATATVRMGLGSVRLRLPRSLGVKVVKESFMTSFDADGLVKRGDAFYSRNWDRAPHRLTLTIEAALGSIDIDWIDD